MSPRRTFLLKEDGGRLELENGKGSLLLEFDFITYSSASDVAALIPNILNGASNFDNLSNSITPGSFQLQLFMEEGYSIINTMLKSNGYAIPVSACAIIRNQVNDIEASYAAYQAELSRSSPRSAVNKRTLKQRDAWIGGLKRLIGLDLTRTNIEYEGKWEIAGIDEFEKSIIVETKDRIPSRFQREQMGRNKI